MQLKLFSNQTPIIPVSKREEPFNVVDLFAGAGGLSAGLEAAGFNIVLGVDQNQDAMKTFARNHKGSKTYCGDISDLNQQTLQELIQNKNIHVVCGGPPCQGFSTAGKSNPDDPRNSLFLEFVRIVKHLQPDYLVLEPL